MEVKGRADGSIGRAVTAYNQGLQFESSCGRAIKLGISGFINDSFSRELFSRWR